MIQRLRDRQSFRRLATDGTRIRRSALWCTWCPLPDSTTTSLAFAIGRAVGPAVVRNRLRRRLREILRELDRTTGLPPGLLMIGASTRAVELTFDQLRVEMISIVRSLPAGASNV